MISIVCVCLDFFIQNCISSVVDIHTFKYSNSSFAFHWCKISHLWIYYSLFFSSTFHRELGCFHFLTVKNCYYEHFLCDLNRREMNGSHGIISLVVQFSTFFKFSGFVLVLLFIFACAGSSLICAGFLQLWWARATFHCDMWASYCSGF